MSLKIKILLIVIAYIFIFPQTVKAEDGYKLHYYEYDNNGLEIWTSKSFDFSEAAAPVEKAKIIFTDFFENKENNLVEDGTKLLDICIVEDELVINVSSEINNYGGRYYETCLKNQIIKTALDIEGINKVTLLIENKLLPLNEGSYIEEATKWQELTAE